MRRSLVVTICRGEAIAIDGGRIIIRLLEKSGQRAKLHCNSADDVCIEPVRESAISDVNTKPLGTFAL